MALGIECLLTDDAGARRASSRASSTRSTASAARSKRDMQDERARAARTRSTPRRRRSACRLFDPSWHQGVVGIVASRLKDRFHRPAIAFAPRRRRRAEGLRPLDRRAAPARRARPRRQAQPGPVAALRRPRRRRRPDASREPDFERFRAAFEHVCARLLTPADLAAHDRDRRLAVGPGADVRAAPQLLQRAVWGQGFPAPLSTTSSTVESQRVVGERHCELRLAKRQRRAVEAMLFGCRRAAARARPSGLPSRRQRVQRRLRALQLTIEHWEPAD